MSLALCPQIVSQAPQFFKYSETQAAGGGCFAHHSVCLVTSLDPGMCRTVQSHESSEVDVEYHVYTHHLRN